MRPMAVLASALVRPVVVLTAVCSSRRWLGTCCTEYSPGTSLALVQGSKLYNARRVRATCSPCSRRCRVPGGAIPKISVAQLHSSLGSVGMYSVNEHRVLCVARAACAGTSAARAPDAVHADQD
jgi:hypothetical protein